MDSNHTHNSLQTAIVSRISLRYYIQTVFKTLETTTFDPRSGTF